MIKNLTHRNWRVELDSTQVIPDDPGAGTPAMVYAPSGASGTYWCVMDTAEIDGEEVPSFVLQWLEKIFDEVDEFVATYSVKS
jgi:hypothetical protein